MIVNKETLEMEDLRVIVLGVLCFLFFVIAMLFMIAADSYHDKYNLTLKANKRLYDENIKLKAKLNFIELHKTDKKEGKK